MTSSPLRSGHPDQHTFGPLDAGTIAVAIGHPGGRIDQATDAFLEMHGYTREDLAEGELSWLTLVPPERKSHARAFIRRLFESGGSQSYRTEHVRKDGQRIPLLVEATRIDDSDQLLCTLTELPPGPQTGMIDPRDAYDNAKERFSLTSREHEILSTLLEGSSNADIAAALFISATTVRDHVQAIMRKIGVRNRGQLFRRVYLE